MLHFVPSMSQWLLLSCSDKRSPCFCSSVCAVPAQLACVRVLALLPVHSLAALAAAGAVPSLIALLSLSHGDSSEVSTHALTALSAMAKSTAEARAKMLQAGALPILRELAKQSVVCTQLLSAAVAALQLQQEETTLLADLPHVCTRLLSADAATSRAAVVSVRKLLSIEGYLPIQQVIDVPGVLDKLVQMARDAADTQMQVGSHYLHTGCAVLLTLALMVLMPSPVPLLCFASL